MAVVFKTQLEFYIEEASELVETDAVNAASCDSGMDQQRSTYLVSQFSPMESRFFEMYASGKEDVNREELKKLFTEFKKLIFKLKAKITPSETETPAQVFQLISDAPTHNYKSPCKLPPIKLPTFSGNYTEFPNFHSLFTSMVIEDKLLSDTQRLQYLKMSLEGEALKQIQSLVLNNDNFYVAWEAIVLKYMDIRRISTTLWNQISHHAPVKNNSQSIETFLTLVNDNLSALRGLKHKIDDWSFLILNTMLEKLDKSLVDQFEMSHDDEVPEYGTLIDFLQKRCKALGSQSVQSPNVDSTSRPQPKKQSNKCLLTTSSTNNEGCPECKQSHSLAQCPKFLKLNATGRFTLAKSCHACINCLKTGHTTKSCPSKNRCKMCSGHHNSYLHFPSKNDSSNNNLSNDSSSRSSSPAAAHISATTSHQNPIDSQSSVVLLPTVLVQVSDAHGKSHVARALLDTASTCSLITYQFAKILKLKPTMVNSLLHGVSSTCVTNISESFKLSLRPVGKRAPVHSINAFSIDRITGSLPSRHVPPGLWAHVQGLDLADPGFGISSPIQLLLGADIVPHIVGQGRQYVPPGTPVALQTSFGWVLTGETYTFLSNSNSHQVKSCSHTNLLISMHASLEEIVEAFWVSEEPPLAKVLKPEDQLCESIFLETTHQDTAMQRYVVPLPFNESPPELGDSYYGALRCFHSLERKFSVAPNLFVEYKAFFDELISSEIIEPVPLPDQVSNPYYLPHHGVLKHDSSSTRLRVVFNGSFHTTNGRSLNDCLLSGPKLQADITDIILNFRRHEVVLIADIQRMFHQIVIRPEDRDYLRLLWRDSAHQPINIYRMTRVPFGLKPSPYLAIRTLKLLASDFKDMYPLASQVVDKELYVDDCLSGASDIESAQLLQSELVALLSKGSLQLRKWASNKPDALANVPLEYQQNSSISLDQDQPNCLKVLGLHYDPRSDSFSYKFSDTDLVPTKRGILSDIARLYDPMGWLAPSIFVAKRILRSIWELKLDWDEQVPPDILEMWSEFKGRLSALSHISLKRCVTSQDPEVVYELHGFSDSSELGYSGVVYLKVTLPDQTIFTNLLIAKSRVAPMRTVSLPRLELCGALLVAKLIKHVAHQFENKIQVCDLYCWTDSTIVLHWIRSHASKWQCIVANRVSQIQELTPVNLWHHVRSEHNPADCASRGILPHELHSHPLWWTGPNWLLKPNHDWPIEAGSAALPIPPDIDLEEKPPQTILKVHLISVTVPERGSELAPLIDRVSTLLILQRSTAWIFRAIIPNKKRKHLPLHLTTSELHSALLFWVERIQHEVFAPEITSLQNDQPIHTKMAKLDPFLSNEDHYKILRVGGRLQNSQLEASSRHPILLPARHKLTSLVISFYHKQFGHPGPQALQAMVSRRFWIINARSAIRTFTLSCVTCFRAKPKIISPFMGSLPGCRVQQVKVFSQAGLDYAGPITLRASKLKKAPHLKGYICVFICLATKACHLEAVSDLTTEAFLAALQRFISRRGRCSDIFCDRGTNFVGGDRELTRFLKSADTNHCIASELSVQAISFHFNPPASPHFGGVWEGLVKSVKYHLCRLIGSQILTFEELSTILCCIEGYLNSRPLTPMSNNPNDLEVLTPGHFLTMEPLVTLPEPVQAQDSPPKDLRNRWLLTRYIHQQFWKRWHNEYLSTLQVRQKWTKKFNNLKVGDLVLLKEDNVPPLMWRRARVTEVRPGSDGVVRTAVIRTTAGTYVRPVVKLAPLPFPDSSQ